MPSCLNKTQLAEAATSIPFILSTQLCDILHNFTDIQDTWNSCLASVTDPLFTMFYKRVCYNIVRQELTGTCHAVLLAIN